MVNDTEPKVTFETLDVTLRGCGRRTIYDFGKLEVGGPAMVIEANLAVKRQNSIRACASSFGKRHDRVFSCQWLDDGRFVVVRTR